MRSWWSRQATSPLRVASILAPGLFGLTGLVGWSRGHVTQTHDVMPGPCATPEKVYKLWPFRRCFLRVCPNLIVSCSFVFIINYYCEVD